MGVPSPSGSLVLGCEAHTYSEDESVDAKEVLNQIGVILVRLVIIVFFSHRILGRS